MNQAGPWASLFMCYYVLLLLLCDKAAYFETLKSDTGSIAAQIDAEEFDDIDFDTLVLETRVMPGFVRRIIKINGNKLIQKCL